MKESVIISFSNSITYKNIYTFGMLESRRLRLESGDILSGKYEQGGPGILKYTYNNIKMTAHKLDKVKQDATIVGHTSVLDIEPI